MFKGVTKKPCYSIARYVKLLPAVYDNYIRLGFNHAIDLSSYLFPVDLRGGAHNRWG